MTGTEARTVLLPFDPAAAPIVAGWARTAEEVRHWCGPAAVPVPTAAVVAWSAPPDVAAFLMSDGGEPVAYGELWTDDEEGEVELAHLVVAPGRRGRGVGRRLVAALVDRALRSHPVAVLRVHADNLAARRCYSAAGFVRASAADEDSWNRGQPLAYVWMVLTARP